MRKTRSGSVKADCVGAFDMSPFTSSPVQDSTEQIPVLDGEIPAHYGIKREISAPDTNGKTVRKRVSTGWRHYWFAVGLLCAVTLAFSLSVRLIFRRTVRMALPDTSGMTGVSLYDPSENLGAATPLEVTPQTVQAVVATLSRPDRYRRTVTVRRTWSGGSSDSELSVTVSGPWTRVDRTFPDGAIRRAVTNGAVTYLWYGDGPKTLRVPSGDITADNEQSIPTYEDVLRLSAEQIALADYHVIESGADCIYIETAQDGAYKRRYWIGASSGLLVAAETLLDGNSVYWMEASEPEEPSPDAFTLPDGTNLLRNP